MLKIKDGINLKELEKYGFKYYDKTGQYKFDEKNTIWTNCMYINVWNKKITFKQEKPVDDICLGVLYDLIKADLVEKVGE